MFSNIENILILSGPERTDEVFRFAFDFSYGHENTFIMGTTLSLYTRTRGNFEVYPTYRRVSKARWSSIPVSRSRRQYL